jgi:hypothetical protein
MRTQLLWLATKPQVRVVFLPAVLVYCTVVVSLTEKPPQTAKAARCGARTGACSSNHCLHPSQATHAQNGK